MGSKVGDVDPGGLQLALQLLQFLAAGIDPVGQHARLALRLFKFGAQLLGRGFGRLQFVAQLRNAGLSLLQLLMIGSEAPFGRLVAAHLLLQGVERLQLLLGFSQVAAGAR